MRGREGTGQRDQSQEGPNAGFELAVETSFSLSLLCSALRPRRRENGGSVWMPPWPGLTRKGEEEGKGAIRASRGRGSRGWRPRRRRRGRGAAACGSFSWERNASSGWR